MFIRNAQSVNPSDGALGERAYELIGASAGGTQAYSLARMVIAPGNSSRKHYHPVAEESYYFLSGSGRLEIDGTSTAVGPGDAMAILPHQVHQIANAGTEDLVFLAVCVPAWTPDNSVYLD